MKILTPFTKYLNLLRVAPSLLLDSPFPRRANLILYITNRCNCRCQICNHWEQPHNDLPLDIIHDLIHSKTVSNKNWLVEGGEVFFHPGIHRILEMLLEHKVNYTLFTNGTLPNVLEDAVKRYSIKSVDISLDGTKGTYNLVRGVDRYEDTLDSIKRIKDRTSVQVNFTASPWNTYQDYLRVKEICKELKVRLMFNIYSEAAKSGIKGKEFHIDEQYIKDEISPYATYYHKWLEGKVNIPCRSQLINVAVFPTGLVHLCPSKFEALGNLYCNSLDEIWNSEIIKNIQKRNLNCNECWVSCYRHLDIKLALLKGEVE